MQSASEGSTSPWLPVIACTVERVIFSQQGMDSTWHVRTIWSLKDNTLPETVRWVVTPAM